MDDERKKRDMARKKYIRDYRLVETVDERGRIRSDYEYIGGSYGYVLGWDAVRREKRNVLIALAAGWLAFAGGLIPNAAGLRAVYAALPYLLAAVPLGILTDTLLTAALPEPLRHQQADMLDNRYPPAALWAAILPAASLIGQGVRLIRCGTFSGADAAALLCTAGLGVCGAFAFSRRGRFACRED